MPPCTTASVMWCKVYNPRFVAPPILPGTVPDPVPFRSNTDPTHIVDGKSSWPQNDFPPRTYEHIWRLHVLDVTVCGTARHRDQQDIEPEANYRDRRSLPKFREQASPYPFIVRHLGELNRPGPCMKFMQALHERGLPAGFDPGARCGIVGSAVGNTFCQSLHIK